MPHESGSGLAGWLLVETRTVSFVHAFVVDETTLEKLAFTCQG